MAEKEYIERNNVISHKRPFTEFDEGGWSCKVQAVAVEDIQNIPAADVAPVRHGRWKKSKGNERPTENGFVHDDRYVCDCCGWGCCCETKLDFSFCPNCGARMDGDADANGNGNKTLET